MRTTNISVMLSLSRANNNSGGLVSGQCVTRYLNVTLNNDSSSCFEGHRNLSVIIILWLGMTLKQTFSLCRTLFMEFYCVTANNYSLNIIVYKLLFVCMCRGNIVRRYWRNSAHTIKLKLRFCRNIINLNNTIMCLFILSN